MDEKSNQELDSLKNSEEVTESESEVIGEDISPNIENNSNIEEESDSEAVEAGEEVTSDEVEDISDVENRISSEANEIKDEISEKVKKDSILSVVKRATPTSVAGVFLIIFLSLTFIVCAYLYNIFPTLTRDKDGHSLVAFKTDDGKVMLLSADIGNIIELGKNVSVSDIMLNSKGDRIYYIESLGGEHKLKSRKLSSLVFDEKFLAEDVESFKLSKDGERIIYLTDTHKLFSLSLNDSRGFEVALDVTEYYISEDGKKIVYQTRDEKKKTDVYLFERKEALLIGDGGQIIQANEDSGIFLIEDEGTLTRFDAKRNESVLLSEKFSSLVAAYDNIVYYTSEGEDSRSLFCYDTAEKLVSSSFSELCFKGEMPFIVFCEDGADISYKVSIGEIFTQAYTLSGSELTDFALTESGEHFFYGDSSREQQILIRASIDGDRLISFTVIDTDTHHIAGTFEEKVIYTKNFNPITNTADLYCNSLRIKMGVSANEYRASAEEARSFRSVYQGIVSEMYICKSALFDSSLIFSASGGIYSYSGGEPSFLCTGEITGSLVFDCGTLFIFGENSIVSFSGGRSRSFDFNIDEIIIVGGN